MNCTRSRWLGLVAGCLALGVCRLPAQVSLVATGAVWRYLDQGTVAAGWTGTAYVDRDWASGPARFGLAGDAAAPASATLLSRTNLAGATNLTFYFRHAFVATDPATWTNLLVRVCRDDGVVIHLNGLEVYRDNMPSGPVTANTPASAPAADEGALFHAAFLPVSRLAAGTNLLAVEIHQASPDSPDLRFDLELAANTDAAPPTVRLAAPTPGEVLGTSRIPLTAEIAAGDRVVTWLEFLADGVPVGTLAPPGSPVASLAWTSAAPGRHTLQAVAMNDTGLRATSAPVVIDVLQALIPRGALWKYLDDGSDLGALPWQAAEFDDSAWLAGPAQLGFGDGDEATLIRSGPPGASFPTTYFRHAFTAGDPAGFTNLVLRILRDDGVIAHLNGVEIFRNNLPEGPVTPLTPSLMAVDDPVFHAARIPPGLLLPGRNVLAVEIHQSGPGSSDLSFDAELLPNVPPQPPRVLLLAPSAGASFLGPLQVTAQAATWDPDNSVVSVALYSGGSPVGTAVPDAEGMAQPAALLAPGTHVLRAVARDADGLSSTSAPVTVEIVAAPVLTTLISTGSVWRFLDTASGPGPGWHEANFDDSGWGSGAGILGYGGLGSGNSLPATLINGGPQGNRYLTTYFRRHFTAANIGAVTNLAFRVIRDDGVVAYLNGTEVFRMNLPPGPVTAATPASANVSGTNELFYAPLQVPALPGLLREGDNILAVELHQDSINTSDAAFDLGLVSVAAPAPPIPPLRLSASLAPPGLILSWDSAGAVLQQATQPQGPYVDLPGTFSPRSIPATNSPAFFRLRQGP